MIFGMITQSCDCACQQDIIILNRNSPITISYFNNLFPQKDVCEAAQSKHDNFDPLSGMNSQKKKVVFVFCLRLFQEGLVDLCLSLES